MEEFANFSPLTAVDTDYQVTSIFDDGIDLAASSMLKVILCPCYFLTDF